jgi:hypothetical protein
MTPDLNVTGVGHEARRLVPGQPFEAEIFDVDAKSVGDP